MQAKVETVCLQLVICKSAHETLRLAAQQWTRLGCGVGAPPAVRELLDSGQLQVCLLHANPAQGFLVQRGFLWQHACMAATQSCIASLLLSES